MGSSVGGVSLAQAQRNSAAKQTAGVDFITVIRWCGLKCMSPDLLSRYDASISLASLNCGNHIQAEKETLRIRRYRPVGFSVS